MFLFEGKGVRRRMEEERGERRSHAQPPRLGREGGEEVPPEGACGKFLREMGMVDGEGVR